MVQQRFSLQDGVAQGDAHSPAWGVGRGVRQDGAAATSGAGVQGVPARGAGRCPGPPDRCSFLNNRHCTATASQCYSQENIPAGGLLPDRKRKSASPLGKSGPVAKKQQLAAAVVATAKPAAVPAAPAVPAEDNIWEQIAEEMGWTPVDCLSHKVTFPKRADAKAKVEPLVLHVKRLRAAGWYLHDQKERWVTAGLHPQREGRALSPGLFMQRGCCPGITCTDLAVSLSRTVSPSSPTLNSCISAA